MVWKSFHIYYSDIDRLILECVHPFLENCGAVLGKHFWERHYAGGPHLRVCLHGMKSYVEEVGGQLQDHVNQFLSGHPSPNSERYSESRAAALLELEGLSPHKEDLAYRNNVILERIYPMHPEVYASPEVAELAESFRHDSNPLVVKLMTSSRSRHEEVLRLYFGLALYVGRGSYPAGSISFKSHWEGFSVTIQAEEAISRIQKSYQDRSGQVVAIMSRVKEQYLQDRFAQDSVLWGWFDLLRKYSQATRKMFEAGRLFSQNPGTVAEAGVIRDRFLKRIQRESSFVRKLWADHRFLFLMQYDLAFQVSRTLVNLLYSLAAAAGLTPIDKMALCYFAYRTVEESHGCNLDNLLECNIGKVLRDHEHRLE